MFHNPGEGKKFPTERRVEPFTSFNSNLINVIVPDKGEGERGKNPRGKASFPAKNESDLERDDFRAGAYDALVEEGINSRFLSGDGSREGFHLEK